MRSFYLLTALASLAAAIPWNPLPERDPERTCDMDGASAELDAWTKQIQKEEAAETVTTRATVTIDTWFHVVSAGQDLEHGNVRTSQINELLVQMNNAYRAHGFSFRSAGTTRTLNAALAIDDGTRATRLARGKRFRRGDYKTLNLYIVYDLSNNAAGRCTFPVTTKPTADQISLDGCSIGWDTLPPKPNNGITAIHEVGHWLALKHSFNAGVDGKAATCTDGSGDGIDDTPTHLVNRSCKEKVNTCPGQTGNDPLYNFMNYTGTCRKEFTPGQQKRMHSAWKLRVGLAAK